MSRVTNPHQTRELRANVFGVPYCIPAGESIDVEDPLHATTLVEYGATMRPEDYAAALDLASERQRKANDRTGSESSPTATATGHQTTVNVESGDVSNLKGGDLDAALKAAGLSTAGKVDEKRARLAAAQAPAEVSPAAGFKVDESGSVVLDDDGNPVPVDAD